MARVTRVFPAIAPGGSYRMALKGAQHEIAELKTKLQTLKAEEAEIERRLQQLQETVNVLRTLCGDDEGGVTPQLTEACLQVLEDSPATVPQIRKKLEDVGVPMASYPNP